MRASSRLDNSDKMSENESHLDRVIGRQASVKDFTATRVEPNTEAGWGRVELRHHGSSPCWSFVVSEITQERTMPLILLGLCAALLGPTTAIKLAPPVKVDVRIITDEADAVLAILGKKKSD